MTRPSPSSTRPAAWVDAAPFRAHLRPPVRDDRPALGRGRRARGASRCVRPTACWACAVAARLRRLPPRPRPGCCRSTPSRPTAAPQRHLGGRVPGRTRAAAVADDWRRGAPGPRAIAGLAPAGLHARPVAGRWPTAGVARDVPAVTALRCCAPAGAAETADRTLDARSARRLGWPSPAALAPRPASSLAALVRLALRRSWALRPAAVLRALPEPADPDARTSPRTPPWPRRRSSLGVGSRLGRHGCSSPGAALPAARPHWLAWVALAPWACSPVAIDARTTWLPLPRWRAGWGGRWSAARWWPSLGRRRRGRPWLAGGARRRSRLGGLFHLLWRTRARSATATSAWPRRSAR